jgi:hypothetical protein
MRQPLGAGVITTSGEGLNAHPLNDENPGAIAWQRPGARLLPKEERCVPAYGHTARPDHTG